MGRHSAQVEDETDDRSAIAVVDVEVDEDAAPAGRHARRDADGPSRTGPSRPRTKTGPRPFGAAADATTARIPAVADPIADEPGHQRTTEQIPAVSAPVRDEPVVAEPVGEPVPDDAGAFVTQPPVPERTRPARGPQHATSADLALLRGNRPLLAAAAVVVIVPFAAYGAVLAVTDHLVLRTSLLWIWAPLVSAGLLLGLVLDAGHRRVRSPGPEASEPSASGPEATEPEATEPEATEPEATGPGATGPGATGPGATGPGATVREPSARP